MSSIAFFLWRGNRRLKKARAADLEARSRARNGKNGAQVCNTMYLLSKWEGQMGKIFGSRSWRTDRAQRAPYAMTESQIFPHPALPNLVNKYFII